MIIIEVQLFCWHKVIKIQMRRFCGLEMCEKFEENKQKLSLLSTCDDDWRISSLCEIGGSSRNFSHNKVRLAITRTWCITQQRVTQIDLVLSSAPPYCGPHTVSSQGWNYPGGETETPANLHTVDLSAHPPYHLPPENFKIPNGHLGSDSGSDGDASMTSATDINMMDSNRNITWVIKDMLPHNMKQ